MTRRASGSKSARLTTLDRSTDGRTVVILGGGALRPPRSGTARGRAAVWSSWPAGYPTRSRLARLASIVLRPTPGSLNATVISSSLRVSLEVTTIPSPQRPWRTRSPSRYWRSPGMIGRGGRDPPRPAGRAEGPRRPRHAAGAPSPYASRLAAQARGGPEG